MSSANILILGGDGYIGWPLTMRLARKYPDHKIIQVDNLCRRSRVEEVGGNSFTAIGTPEERLQSFERIYEQKNIEYVSLDLTTGDLHALLAKYQPDVIYHLAQQASAHYSMMSEKGAVDTLINNEMTHMKLMWAVRAKTPKAHLIKMGSFGEYATHGEIDVAEGFFKPSFNGKEASTEIPFPRETGDFYHASKINDSVYGVTACKKWGIKITDLMQSTVFGATTEEIQAHPELATRFDYDTYFGTVMNRFITQAVSSQDLTVYGTGKQRSGLMALCDTVTSLAQIMEVGKDFTGYTVINHVTEKSLTVTEIAELVVNNPMTKKFDAKITREVDPRGEATEHILEYDILTNSKHQLPHTPIEEVIAQTVMFVDEVKANTKLDVMAGATSWKS